jgi:hypothetical protein
MIEDMEDLHVARNAHEEADDVNRNRVWTRAMIDTLSLLLAHFLLGFVAIRMLNNPYLNEEPSPTGRHFKPILPKKQPGRAGVETGEARPGSNRA